MKKNEPVKKPSQEKTVKKDTKTVAKTNPVSKPSVVEKSKTQVIPTPAQQMPQAKEVDKPAETTTIKLTDLAPIFEGEDRRVIYLVDETGNSYTFFKYKARLIDIPSYHLEIHIKGTPRQSVMDTIRKQLVYGIKRGELLVFHIGDGALDLNEFFKGEAYWQPEQLFRKGGTYDEKWFQTQLAKPTDRDAYDDSTSPLPFPHDKVLAIISTSTDAPAESQSWLKPCLKQIRRLKIV